MVSLPAPPPTREACTLLSSWSYLLTSSRVQRPREEGTRFLTHPRVTQAWSLLCLTGPHMCPGSEQLSFTGFTTNGGTAGLGYHFSYTMKGPGGILQSNSVGQGLCQYK